MLASLWLLAAVVAADPMPAAEAPPAPPAELVPVAPPTLTLYDAVQTALVNNPDLGVSQAAVRAAAGRRQTANAALLPDLTVGYSEVWQQQQTASLGGGPAIVITPGNVRTFTLSSNWVLFAGGALRANQAIARLGEAAARQQQRAQVNAVVAQTVRRYLELLRAQELLQVADRSVDVAREQSRVAGLTYQAGSVPRVNVLRAEAALQNALQGQMRAATGIATADAALKNVMGVPQTQALRVEPLPRQLADAPELLPSLQLAVLQRPELRAQQRQIEVDQAAVRAARSGYYPSVALSGQGSTTSAASAFGSSEDFRFVLGVNWTVWDWGATAGQVKTADAQVVADRNRLERQVHDIEFQVRTAVLGIEEAKLRVSAAESEAVAAREALRIEQLRYAEGAGTILDLLDARRVQTEAEANVVSAYYDNALAEADWLGATGGYVSPTEAVLTPQGQTMPSREREFRRGSTYQELLRQYGIEPVTADETAARLRQTTLAPLVADSAAAPSNTSAATPAAPAGEK